MAVAITKARWARCRKKELSIPRRCAKVEAAIKTGMAILASTLGQSKASILVERAGKIILNPKNKRKTTIIVRDFFIQDKERSTRLGEKDLGVLSRLFLSYSASLVSAKEVVDDM